jgi:hypothetical protein
MVSSPSPSPTAAECVLPAARRTFQNAHFSIWVDAGLGIVVTQRTELPFATMDQLHDVYDELGDALDELGRSRYVLMADMRAVLGRNDPEFDQAIQRQLPRWLGGFRKVGVFVRTLVGVMQIQRHSKQDGIERLASTQLPELLRYFAEP